MKTICYVHKDIADIERGGISTLFKTLAIGARDSGWKVYCITQQDLNILGIETIKLPIERDPHIHGETVAEQIEKIKPDIAECSTWRFELLEYLKSSLKQARVVVRCEPSTETMFTSLTEYTEGEKVLCEKADFRIAVSNYAKNDIEKRYKVSVDQVIYNGIDTGSLRSMIGKVTEVSHGEVTVNGQQMQNVPIESLIDSTKINVLWCGKATKMKGYDYLSNIISSAKEDKFNWIINIGNSPEEVIWDKSVKDRVIFVKNITKEEQVNLWHQCDVFLSTSRYEGFGLVVAESLALGLPVILNQECEVYSEFLPNEAISLISIEQNEIVIESLLNSNGKKSSKSHLPTRFESSQMVLASLKAYSQLLK